MKTFKIKDGIYPTIDFSLEEGDFIQVEIFPEIGFRDKSKVYIHLNGQTIVRLCKVNSDHIEVYHE